MKALWVSFGMLIPISIIGLPIIFSLIKRSARKEEPVTAGTALEFSLGRGMAILVRAVLVLLAAFTIFILVTVLSNGGSLLAVAIPMSVFASLFFAVPRAVILDDAGIRQRRWLLPNRQAGWDEIATLSRGQSTGRIFVWSATGKIAAIFSPQMVGLRRFEHEIRARARNAVFEYD